MIPTFVLFVLARRSLGEGGSFVVKRFDLESAR
jgi:hypothetical protein